MKTEEKIASRLKDAIRDVLSTICLKDENGMFYTMIDVDYRDELSDQVMREICNDKTPRDKLWELLYECYCDQECDVENSIIKWVLEDEDVAELIENLDEAEVRALIRDQFYVKYPEKHYLAQDVCVDLVVDTGDLNYDFTSNNIGGHYDASDDSIPGESSLLWLARQQGYKKSELKKALADRGNSQPPLLKSIYRETLNCGTHMNALVFLVKMTLEEYFNLRDAIDIEEKRNKSCYLSARTGRGYLVLSKDTTCGLYDSWNGSGSVLAIKLEKDVRLPFRCIASADHDGCHGYGIREIYGCGSELWSDDAVKEIHPMKKPSKKLC
jgi:hypothetical protein